MTLKFNNIKHIITSALVLAISTICNGHNHLFDIYENQMNQRYGYYGPPVQDATQGAFNILYKKFGRRINNRLVSFNANDWAGDVTKFIRVDYGNIPILNQTDFKGDNLQVIGFTKTGELLQYITHKEEWVKIINLGHWRFQNWGDWYQVRTMNGDNGWIFAKPYGLNYAFVSFREKVISKPIDNDKSNSGSPIWTIVIAALVLILVGVIGLIIFKSFAPKSGYVYISRPYSTPSYTSEYDSGDNAVSKGYQDNEGESKTSNTDSTKRCTDCQSIDINFWRLDSKGNGRCKECDGKGYDQSALVQIFTLGVEDGKSDCKTCYGTGQCQICGGTGEIQG